MGYGLAFARIWMDFNETHLKHSPLSLLLDGFEVVTTAYVTMIPPSALPSRIASFGYGLASEVSPRKILAIPRVVNRHVEGGEIFPNRLV